MPALPDLIVVEPLGNNRSRWISSTLRNIFMPTDDYDTLEFPLLVVVKDHCSMSEWVSQLRTIPIWFLETVVKVTVFKGLVDGHVQGRVVYKYGRKDEKNQAIVLLITLEDLAQTALSAGFPCSPNFMICELPIESNNIGVVMRWVKPYVTERVYLVGIPTKFVWRQIMQNMENGFSVNYYMLHLVSDMKEGKQNEIAGRIKEILDFEIISGIVVVGKQLNVLGHIVRQIDPYLGIVPRFRPRFDVAFSEFNLGLVHVVFLQSEDLEFIDFVDRTRSFIFINFDVEKNQRILYNSWNGEVAMIPQSW